MTTKKCPKCNLWNSENAQVCDCGYNFVQNKIDNSISREEEYNKILQYDGKSISDIPVIHKNIYFRILLSLLLFYFVNLPIHLPIKYISCIVILIIIVVNVYERNKYFGLILRKVWKYPLLGIVLGFIISYAIMMALIAINTAQTHSSYANYDFNEWHYLLFDTFIFTSAFIGLFIGKKRVLDNIENSV